MFDPLLTPQQVAELLSVRPVTVYAAAADGRLPAVRVWSGKKKSLLRFRRSEIEKVLREGSTIRVDDSQRKRKSQG